MKTLKVTLKQHTPLIHFQHDQYGATLRASEVKPKLDKYIIQHKFNNDFFHFRSLLKVQPTGGENNPQDRRSLDYKMSIIPYEKKDVSLDIKEVPINPYSPNEDNRKYTTEDFPMMLCNMGGKESKDDLANLIFHNILEIKIMTSNEELYQILKEIIPAFFANTNFGQRSSKGFGSFTVLKINNEVIKWKASLYYKGDCLFFKIPNTNEKKKQKILFKILDFYWKCLKGGINYKGGYIKSYLYYYLNNLISPAYTWEKRSIKTTFNLGRLSRNTTPNNNRVIFARALLGCPEKYLYGEKEVSVEHYTDNEEQKIARIPTPIYFKPVCNGNYVYIYILFESSIIEKLRNIADITFRMRYKERSLDLSVEPFIDENNYMSFIEEYHEYLNSNEDVLDALYKEIPREKYADGQGNSLDDESYGFVPKDYNWNDILGNMQYVSINNI